MVNAKRQQKYYNETVRNLRVNNFVKKLLNSTHSNLCVCSYNYRTSNAQAPCHIDIAGLPPTLCHIIPIISSSAQFSERRYLTYHTSLGLLQNVFRKIQISKTTLKI